MKQIITFICLACLAGCNRTTTEAEIENHTPRAIAEQEARQLASKHANLFLNDKTYTRPDGTKHPFPAPFTQPSTWNSVSKTTNGWVVLYDPPKGAYVYVRMDLDGNNTKVTDYGFSPD